MEHQRLSPFIIINILFSCKSPAKVKAISRWRMWVMYSAGSLGKCTLSLCLPFTLWHWPRVLLCTQMEMRWSGLSMSSKIKVWFKEAVSGTLCGCGSLCSPVTDRRIHGSRMKTDYCYCWNIFWFTFSLKMVSHIRGVKSDLCTLFPLVLLLFVLVWIHQSHLQTRKRSQTNLWVIHWFWPTYWSIDWSQTGKG